jgi:hypothetical protein
VQQGKKFVFFKKNSSPSVALGEEFCFFKKNPLPRVLILGTRGRILAAVFNKTLFPECHCLGTRGSHVFFLKMIFRVNNKYQFIQATNQAN